MDSLLDTSYTVSLGRVGRLQTYYEIYIDNLLIIVTDAYTFRSIDLKLFIFKEPIDKVTKRFVKYPLL